MEGSNEILVVRVLGGLPDPEAYEAHSGGHRWVQGPDESEKAFKARVSSAARAKGEKLIVLGGLPA